MYSDQGGLLKDVLTYWEKELDRLMAGRETLKQADVLRLSLVKSDPKYVKVRSKRDLQGPEADRYEDLMQSRRTSTNRLINKRLFADGEPPDGTSYTRDQALRVLIALDLNVNHSYELTEAASTVRGMMANRSAKDVAREFNRRALERVERLLLSRFWEVALRLSFGIKQIQAGSLSALVWKQEMPPLAATDDEQKWAVKQLQRDKEPGLWRWMATERPELILFPAKVPKAFLKGKEIQIRRIGEFGLILASPGHLPGPASEESTSARNGTALAEVLLRAMTEGFDRLSAYLYDNNPHELPASLPETPAMLHHDLLVWLVARFGCYLAAPDAPERARCYVYSPNPATVGEAISYQCLASSNLEKSPPSHMPELENNLLLSGYAASAGLTLAIPRSAQPLDRLVAHLREERTLTGDQTPAHVAIPIVTASGAPLSVMYLVFPSVDDEGEFEVRVRALQVFAPIMGELIDRSHATVKTLNAATEAVSAQCVNAGHLRQEIINRVKGLVRSASSGDLRLAFVVLSPEVVHPSLSAPLEEWIRQQLKYVVPGTFIASWVAANPEFGSISPPVYGLLDDGVGLMMIPAWLEKHQIDRLRTALPLRMNGLGYAQSFKPKSDVFGLNVWIIDLSWSEFTSSSVEDVVDESLRKCREHARVTSIAVQAFRQAYREGELKLALDTLERGLKIQPENPYFLRRSAEFNLALGNFEEAAKQAKRATDCDHRSVSARCLWGNALLGQGLLLEAVRAYVQAIDERPSGDVLPGRHPLPSYALGQALLSAARLLDRWLAERAMSVVTGESSTHLIPPDVEAAIRPLAENMCGPFEGTVSPNVLGARSVRELSVWLVTQASKALNVASERLRDWGHSHAPEGHRNYEWTACLLAQARSARYGKEDAVQELQRVIKFSKSKDDLLQNELLYAYMCRDPKIVERMLVDLAREGALSDIVSAVDACAQIG